MKRGPKGPDPEKVRKLVELVRGGMAVNTAAHQVQLGIAQAYYQVHRAGIPPRKQTKGPSLYQVGKSSAKESVPTSSQQAPAQGEPLTLGEVNRASAYVMTMQRRGQVGHVFAGDDWWVIEAIPRMAEKLRELGLR